MILCDTNILIEFYKGNQQILDALQRIDPTNMAVSVVTVGELYYGARDRRELSNRLPWMKKFHRSLST